MVTTHYDHQMNLKQKRMYTQYAKGLPLFMLSLLGIISRAFH